MNIRIKTDPYECFVVSLLIIANLLKSATKQPTCTILHVHGHWMSGESWLAIKDLEPTIPGSQDWAFSVSFLLRIF